MVVKEWVIQEQLKELDTVLEELSKYRDKQESDLAASLSLRWIIERGLLAAATLVFDILDHILSAAFGEYSQTYEDTLRVAHEEGLLSNELYSRMKGLGGFRNILVHEYVRIDLRSLCESMSKAFGVFPAFSVEIQKWLKKRAE